MENFSNELFENVAINALTPDEYGLGVRGITFDKMSLTYDTALKKWFHKYADGPVSHYRDWSSPGFSNFIIGFLCKAKPDFERELLRAKSELDLTKKTVYAL